MSDVVDLRSDTVTSPSSAMRAAMAAATVGDDGFGEDPTVRELEHAFAVPWELGPLDAIAALGLPVYMDGARLFNASVATGIAPADYAARATAVMTCLSKGLGAPVGSLFAGTSDDIERARLERKRLG